MRKSLAMKAGVVLWDEEDLVGSDGLLLYGKLPLPKKLPDCRLFFGGDLIL